MTSGSISPDIKDRYYKSKSLPTFLKELEFDKALNRDATTLFIILACVASKDMICLQRNPST
ncbi:unnamed protein product [Onchocerca flexuosa]|uniref:Transposase n=1 Tax=Onchocerca flexuosa TaxID=387005 RepID=A0A183I0V4_9BILA|nr:unnamed protein product [Onchocerca flexuosa]